MAAQAVLKIMLVPQMEFGVAAGYEKRRSPVPVPPRAGPALRLVIPGCALLRAGPESITTVPATLAPNAPLVVMDSGLAPKRRAPE
jgi:hypothetical protein